MSRLAARGLWARRWRLTGLLAAVFLGVAFLTGTLALSATMSSAISSAFTTAYQGVSAVARSATTTSHASGKVRGPIPGSVVAAIASVPGVADAQGEVLGFGTIAGSDGQAITGTGPRSAGTWITDPGLNPWHLVAGASPRGGSQVVIDQSSATAGHLHVGQVTTVFTPDPVRVTISGIAGYGGGQPTDGGSSYAAFTLAGAQLHLLGGAGEVSQVVASARPGVTQEQLASAIRAVVPAEIQVITGTQATAEQLEAVNSEFLTFFKAFLGIFAGIALLVAALSIHNTFGMVAAQRVRESALLRVLGASRRQIAVGLLAEAAALGLTGAAAGVAAGYGMAVALKGAFAGLGFDLPVSGVVFTAGNAGLGLAVGAGITVLAALHPALRASRTAPVAALRDSDSGSGSGSSGTSRPRAVTGAVLTAGGAAIAAVAALSHSSIAQAGLGAVLTLAGVILLGPLLAAAAGRALGSPAARPRGLPGRLAGRNMARSPGRTAAAASALTVGVAIVTLFTVFGASLKASTGDNLNQTFTGDLVVSAGGGYGGSGFSPQVAARIGSLAGVRAAAGTQAGSVLINGASQQVTVAASPATLGEVFTIGAVPPGQLAVSAAAAAAHGWRAGSVVQVTFADGRVLPMTIGTVYPAITALGDYVLPAATWAAHDTQPLDQDVYVALRPGADAPAITAQVASIARKLGAGSVQDRAQYLASASFEVNEILGVVYLMLALAIVIALLGIGNTLALAVHERTREIGLLRAIGASRRQVRATIRWEAVLTALLGTGTGAALGLFLGWGLVATAGGSPKMDIGVVAVPWTQIVVILVVGAVAGLLAGARPARRATRLDPLTAIAAE